MVKNYKPTTPGRRGASEVDFSVLTKKKPEKSLVEPLQQRAGRDSRGRISVRHQGGGHKRLYRIVDFTRDKLDIPAKVAAIEYDPNRSAFIALLHYADGEKRYILAAEGLKIGQTIITSEKAPLEIGNRLPLKNIPVGTQVYNIELTPGRGGQMVKTAGSFAQVLANEGGYIHLQLPSKEVRIVSEKAMATIGQVSNMAHNTITIGKAGRNRWMGVRPTVRGSAMNPVDHPHGGGEGRAPIGLKHPKTPWGKTAMGKKTRNKKKASNRYIVKRRK